MAKSKGKSAVTFGVMGLLILGLAGFGLTDFGGSIRSVATVGEAEVTTEDYSRAVQQQMRRFSQQTGQQMTFQQARAFGIDQIALGQLITSAALENEAIELGLSVGDETVGERIQNMPDFVNASGEFDRAVYEATLRQNGLNAGDFENRIRSDVSEALLQSAVSAGVETPDVFVNTFYNYARETRNATWVRLGADDLDAPLAVPTESDLTTFHADNGEDFTRPETKAITYAWLTPDMLVDDIEVDDTQLQELYQIRINEFVQPERRLVERLVYLDEDQASAAQARLEAGEVSYDDLVAERGLALSDVDLGDVAIEDLGAAGEAIFALTDPGVVGPLLSDLGPALFRMNGILAARETTFEDAREDLRRDAASDRARRLILDTRTTVDDLLAGGADMALLAERTDLEQGRIDWNVENFDGVAAYAAFRNTAEAANPGDFAGIAELEDGGLVVLTVDAVEPPTVLPLDEVRDDVVEGWTLIETEKALTAQAEALAEALRGGADLTTEGFASETSTDLGRTGFVEGTPPDFITTLFDMAEGDYRTLSADGDVWLVRLDAITAPDLASPEANAERDQFARQSAADFSNAVMTAFSQAIVNSTGVELNQSAINAVHTHLP